MPKFLNKVEVTNIESEDKVIATTEAEAASFITGSFEIKYNAVTESLDFNLIT